MPLMLRLRGLCLIGIWSACSAQVALSAEPLFLPNGKNDEERIQGPVRRVVIAAKDTVATLGFSQSGELTHKMTSHRDDPPNAPGETTVYRYDTRGRKLGEYVVDSDGELVPMRLYAYGDNTRLSAEAAYHLCRTFSALHIYTYDGSGRLIVDLEYASRRLTRREFQYGANEEVARATIHRNGRLQSTARYTYDDSGRMSAVVLDQADGAVISRLYRYDDHEAPIVFSETHPHDPTQNKVEITTYEYDARGNWTRRTIIRAVNPLDEDGQPLEEPIQVTEREIIYADSAPP